MINIFCSSGTWDHVPTAAELRDKIDPGIDQIVRRMPAERSMISNYIDICGFTINQNATAKTDLYSTEILYYIDRDNNIVTGDLSAVPNINII